MVYFEIAKKLQLKILSEVSILVLMDGVLRAESVAEMFHRKRSFNPCSNGWCTSSREIGIAPPTRLYIVSILVLMDGVLRAAAYILG